MMATPPFDSIAAVGDAGDSATWSGIPFHFCQAALARGWNVQPWRLRLPPFRWTRRWWNLGQVGRLRRPGGFQYSPRFLDAAEAQIPGVLKMGRVLSFNSFFPRARTLARHGGELVVYLDATFPRLLDRYGLARDMDRRTADEALQAERENLAQATAVVAFQQWTADSLVAECGVDPEKVSVVLPGANLPEVPPPPKPTGERPGLDRPLVLGFVGKDWKRKGLEFLVEVARRLEARDVPTRVRCAGGCPPELQRDQLVEAVGFIHKTREPGRFIDFLASCDLGCLFSRSEASSIAVLEFIGCGVPVAGFVVDGMGDLFLPDCSLRFTPEMSADLVAAEIAAAVRQSGRFDRLRTAAVAAQGHVSWDRCLQDLQRALPPRRATIRERAVIER